MDNRKRVTVKLEVYEDQEETFLASVYFMKKALEDKTIENMRNNYRRPEEDFDKHQKPYLEFFKKIFDCIYTEDDEVKKASEEVVADKEDEYELISVEENKLVVKYGYNIRNKEQFNDTKEFINRSKLLKRSLSKSKIEDLAHNIQRLIETSNPYITEKSKFWKAANSIDNSSYLLNMQPPSPIRQAIEYLGMINLRIFPNESIDTSTKEDKNIYVCNMFSIVSELFENQIRILTGYICHFFGFFKAEDDFLETTKSADWRNSLSKKVKTHLDYQK